MSTTTPAAPISTTAPEQMSDTQLTDEVAALNDHQAHHLTDVTGYELRTAVWAIAERRSALTAEITRRAAARRRAETARREEAQRQARLDRTDIGRRDAEGRYPVRVDGVLRAHVRRVGRFWLTRLNEDHSDLAGSESRRSDAVDRVVRVLDQRAEAERRAAERAAAPEGWILAGESEEPEVGEVVRYSQPASTVPWSQPLRVTARPVEPPPYGARLRLEPLDGKGPGTSLSVARLPRFARPTEATAADFPEVPFRHREPREAEARRIMGGEIGDELAGLSRCPALPERAERALQVLTGVVDGTSEDPAADLRAVAEAAEAIRAATLAGWDADRSYRASSARAARILAARYAERFEASAGRLTPTGH